jgi:hypothetical protein
LSTPSIFLSGYISHPDSCWRSKISTSLSHLPITILNPLRRDWDSSWSCTPSDPRFLLQTRWELAGLSDADVIVVNFGATQAIVSLLEMGLALGEGKKVIVCCEQGYRYWGNVKITCGKYGMEVFERAEEFTKEVVVVMEALVKENEERE